MAENGFCKMYYLQMNSYQNFKLMNLMLVKLFILDDYEFEEEVLGPLNDLYQEKQSDIVKFYENIIGVPASSGIY